MTKEIEDAYKYCQSITISHYENFPVASILIPKEQRNHVFAIYAFARTADDIVDNPNLASSEKEKQLGLFKSDFDRRKNYYKKKNHQICLAVNHSIEVVSLDRNYFYDLLEAFNQDIHKSEYKSLEELEEYAKRSANPVGRLLLQLFNQSTAENNRLSDLFCSALQFINFWQDLSVDSQMRRFYIPTETILTHGYELEDFYFDISDDRHDHLINQLLDWTEVKFIEAKQLIKNLSGRFKIELWLTWWGANLILRKCKQMRSQLLLVRPKLSIFFIIKTLINFK